MHTCATPGNCNTVWTYKQSMIAQQQEQHSRIEATQEDIAKLNASTVDEVPGFYGCSLLFRVVESGKCLVIEELWSATRFPGTFYSLQYAPPCHLFSECRRRAALG